ncbi:MAG TPA: nucleotidyltransferase domain-containing protein [Anaerolineales bacterium]|nr:nucleotidyltransferase domain-containing protein [Anaerolineales bacterium]
MRTHIIERLHQIEVEHRVVILYACESGSRAWGFPSADSDYDIRFIYVHPMEWYLTIQDKPDVLQFPIEDNLDFSGWDIRKALGLFRKSNPPLLEWLGSPIVYQEKGNFANRLRDLSKEYYSPTSCIYHYLHMAQGKYRERVSGKDVRLKKYFYLLRPLLAIKWIEQGLGVAPTAFSMLLEKVDLDPVLKDEINRLMILKALGSEADRIAQSEIVNQFAAAEIQRLECETKPFQSNLAPFELLDGIFRTIWEQVDFPS